MEQLNTNPYLPAINIPQQLETQRLSFKDYLNENSSMLHQCDDSEVMFHVSFLSISHAIEKAMLFLHWKPSFDNFADFFNDGEGLILAYQSKWLTNNGYERWQEDCLKIAESSCPTITGKRRINEAIKVYMDKHFLMDIILSELKQIQNLTPQELKFIFEKGIPFLKEFILLSELEPIELTLLGKYQ